MIDFFRGRRNASYYCCDANKILALREFCLRYTEQLFGRGCTFFPEGETLTSWNEEVIDSRKGLEKSAQS